MKHSTSLAVTISFVVWSGSRVGVTQDIIRLSVLGDRGVIFQTLPIDGWLAMNAAQGVGDVNGDGFDDLLVSACDKTFRPTACDFVLVYGRPDLAGRHVLDENLSGTVRFRTNVTMQDPTTEGSCAAAGDLNGDGFADFLLAYPYYPVDGLSRGRAHLVYGSKDLKGVIDVEDLGVTVPGVTFYSSDPTSQSVGRALLRIGDLNSDGKPDLAIA